MYRATLSQKSRDQPMPYRLLSSHQKPYLS